MLGLLAAAPFLMAGCREKTSEAVLAAGKPFPEFQLPDLEGRMLRLDGGSPLLLNFWATWCPPCRAEMGGLERLYREMRSTGLAVIGISIDDDINLVREFVLQSRITFPILIDRAAALTRRRLALRVFPTTVLIGRSGLVSEVVVGERNWDALPARGMVRALVAG